MSKLTHFDVTGRAAMVDVSNKAVTNRKAVAIGQVKMAAKTLTLIEQEDNKKGDVFSVAELAGIMGAKKTSDLIPLCHPLTAGQTGVEMEALTAVSIACLTIYDMLKAVDKHMIIGDIMLTQKLGGKSGDWRR